MINKNSKSNFVINKCRSIVLNKKKMSLDEIIKVEENDLFISNFIKTEKIDNLYNMLEDKISKKTLLRVSTVRYLFAFDKEAFSIPIKKLSLSFNSPAYNIYEWIFKRILFNTFLKYFSIQEVDTHIKFHTIVLKQYDIKNIFEVKDDDIVFDVGAWKGDTAYYFSKNCNDNAQIYCFEPDDNAFETLKNVCKKYSLNNTKPYNILFSDKAMKIDFLGMEENTTVEKDAISIDDFVLDNNITKLDFIKMDVEGAELTILKGAINTIKNLRPCLAIAIYHGGELYFEDFITVPSFIKEITPNYKYYIRSFTPWGAESIIYCVPN